jgi:hypothetical protein
MVAAGVAVTTGLYRFTDLFVKHYAPTPYDDVLAALVDREQAARFGLSVPAAMDAKSLAGKLRTIFKSGGLITAAKADAVAGRVMEADGWIVPQSVALLSALAAKV